MKPSLAPRMRDMERVRRCDWPDCRAACCIYGAWVDEAQVTEIFNAAQLIRPFMSPGHQDSATWFTAETEPDPYVPSGSVRHTRVVDDPAHYGGTACIFMQPDYRCALQRAGKAAGYHPWHFKPFYCILHPLDLDEKGRITLDEARLMVNEPGSCLKRAENSVKLQQLFQEELAFLEKEG